MISINIANYIYSLSAKPGDGNQIQVEKWKKENMKDGIVLIL